MPLFERHICSWFSLVSTFFKPLQSNIRNFAFTVLDSAPVFTVDK